MNDGNTNLKLIIFSLLYADDLHDNKTYNQEWNETAIIDRWNWFCKEVAEVLKIDTSSLMLVNKISQ